MGCLWQRPEGLNLAGDVGYREEWTEDRAGLALPILGLYPHPANYSEQEAPASAARVCLAGVCGLLTVGPSCGTTGVCGGPGSCYSQHCLPWALASSPSKKGLSPCLTVDWPKDKTP